MTTTTHIRPPRENGYMGDDAAVLGSLLASCRLMTVGTMSEERKFGPSRCWSSSRSLLTVL